MTRTHRVTRVEDVPQLLARQYRGVALDDVLTHPDNQPLFAIRRANILAEGDTLVIPEPSKPREVEIATDQKHRFVYRPPRRPLALAIRDAAGDAVVTEPFTLRHGETVIEDSTDGDGFVRVEIPVAWQSVELEVRGRRRRLRVAALEPVARMRGVQARLRNLGYDVGPVDGRFGIRVSRAIAQFQTAHGLDRTGHCDPKTRTKLVEVHGS
jgi:hypothetical protein